jgi:hypothetical protein
MYINDQTNESPKLKVYLNLDNLLDLPKNSIFEERKEKSLSQLLKEDGFDGAQVTDFYTHDDIGEFSLPRTGLDRINKPEESEEILKKHRELGDQGVTLHVGWGMESDHEMDLLVESILHAIQKYKFPAFIETHRATITQDMWRTVELTKRFPEVLFNGDFSHYYCGQEMVYGNIEEKWDFLQPIFDRVGHMHGRIASPGNIQAPIESTHGIPKMAAVGEVDYLSHFKEMWKRSMAGFKKNAGSGDVLIFCPELLRSGFYYARVFPDANGNLVEESDRYAEALMYVEIARECFKDSPSGK